ncbi:RNA polymerase [Trichoplusia ni ascovirus 6b]|nr:RNA polymerase [Trichoplusia ni ascovirus 6b]
MEISSIDFELMSDNDMEELSTYEVTRHRQGPNNDTTGTVFDIRSGAQGNKPCGTCGQGAYDCPGHFGHINLAKPIIHPLFLHQVRDIMRIICRACHKPIMTEKKVKKIISSDSVGPKRISDLVQLVDRRGIFCMHCNTVPAQYKLSAMPTTKTSKAKKKIHRVLCQVIGTQKKWLNDEEVATILDDIPQDCVDTILKTVHPSRMILRKWLVIPPVCRHLENGRSDIQRDDDLTVLLCDIVRLNNIAKDLTQSCDDRDKALADVKTKISVYCTNTAKVKRNDNGDMVRGIIDRIKGKHGLIRNNLLGKRSEMAGRTVIGPDPTLKLDQVGFPRVMAQHLYIPEKVTESNLQWAEQMVLHNGTKPRIIRNGKMKKDCAIQCGDFICRPLQDGDIVLMNRQPTLHKGSMMAFRIRLHESLTFTLNLATTKAFNADFDGDEMNCFVPQSVAASVELQHLSTPTACLNSGDKASICIVQDCLTAAYCMSIEDIYEHTVPRDVAFDIILASNANVSNLLEKIDYIRHRFNIPRHVFNGKMLISLAFPAMFYFQCGDLIIDDGILISGCLSKRTLGPTRDSIIRKIGNDISRDAAGEFVDRLQFITTAWMTYKGFTVTAKDFLHAGELISNIADSKMADVRHMCNTIIDENLKEYRINTILATAKDVGMNIVKKNSGTDCSNLAIMIESGSKGDYFNVGQTKGMLGQQLVNGCRIPMVINDGMRSCVHSKFSETRHDVLIKNRGFITRGFSNGLDPREWIFHCMSGRESVCSSATETADTGYTTRRVNKFGEDIIIHNDGVVADNNGIIYQMAYGDLGLDPEKTSTNIDYIIRSIGGTPR